MLSIDNYYTYTLSYKEKVKFRQTERWTRIPFRVVCLLLLLLFD